MTWNLLKTNRKMTYISANPWRNELHGIDEHGLIYEMTDISNPSWNQIDLGIIEKPTAIISNDSSKLIAVKGIKVYHHQSNSLSLVMSHSSPDYDIKHLSWTSRCLFLTFNTNWQQYSTSIIEKAYGFPEIGHYRQVSCLETHCWGANRNSMVFARISGSCGVHHDAYKNRQNIDYVSVAVTKTEVWGIQSGGKVITRRLQVIPDSSSMYGNDWFDFPLFLPKPAKWIAIGKMGVFVLLTSGEVAVFQGKVYITVNCPLIFSNQEVNFIMGENVKAGLIQFQKLTTVIPYEQKDFKR